MRKESNLSKNTEECLDSCIYESEKYGVSLLNSTGLQWVKWGNSNYQYIFFPLLSVVANGRPSLKLGDSFTNHTAPATECILNADIVHRVVYFTLEAG